MGTVYISELACKPLLKWLDESGEQVKLIDGEGFMADPKIGPMPICITARRD